jgi:hypothetical protein
MLDCQLKCQVVRYWGIGDGTSPGGGKSIEMTPVFQASLDIFLGPGKSENCFSHAIVD